MRWVVVHLPSALSSVHPAGLVCVCVPSPLASRKHFCLLDNILPTAHCSPELPLLSATQIVQTQSLVQGKDRQGKRRVKVQKVAASKGRLEQEAETVRAGICLVSSAVMRL